MLQYHVYGASGPSLPDTYLRRNKVKSTMVIIVTSNNSLLISIEWHLVSISGWGLVSLAVREAVYHFFFITLWHSWVWWSDTLLSKRSTARLYMNGDKSQYYCIVLQIVEIVQDNAEGMQLKLLILAIVIQKKNFLVLWLNITSSALKIVTSFVMNHEWLRSFHNDTFLQIHVGPFLRHVSCSQWLNQKKQTATTSQNRPGLPNFSNARWITKRGKAWVRG